MSIESSARVRRNVHSFNGKPKAAAQKHNTGASGFDQPRHYLTDMLVTSDTDAAATVYARNASAAVEEVGSACRVCPRRTCPQRVEDPLAG